MFRIVAFSFFYTNSQINVGGTTTFDIGNDVNIKGGVINTNRAQGAIGGDVNIESLQDTATYDSKQKNMGFSADLDMTTGKGSSLSVNGGKTNLNADYQAVGEQSGIFTGDGGLDLTAKGKTTLIGGAITTTEAARDAGRNNYESLGGITTQDIKNTTSYEGDAIQVGVSVGNTNNKPQASMNGLGYGKDSDSDSSVTRAGITGISGNKDITTDNRADYAGILENNFDAGRVNKELDAQTQITQAFDQERRKVKTEINAKEKKLRDDAEEQGQLGNTTARDKLIEQADKVQNQGLLFDAISGAIYGPNSNGATGYVAKAASPFVANQIGQYYKEQSETQGNSLTGSQQAGHILAHGILGAAVSYATGNDALTGGVSAGTGEASAPVVSNFLYGSNDPANLTAEQKDTISAITSAVGLTIGATTGSANDAANAAETSKVAVEDNSLKNKDANILMQRINAAKRKYTGGKLDSEMRKIRELMGAMAAANWKEIQNCQNNPTDACLKQIKIDYGNVDFKSLNDAYREYQGTDLYIDSYEQRNNSLVSCGGSRPTDCVLTDQFQKTVNGAVYEAIGAGSMRKVASTKPASKKATKSKQPSHTRDGMEPDNDFYSNKPSGIKEIDPNTLYSGGLVKVPKRDADADKLATKLHGESRVKFANDPKGKEFDTISNKYIAETKPGNYIFNKRGRTQAKRAFSAAKETGRSVYYHFDGNANPDTVKILKDYSKRYGVKLTIDTEKF